ncbi:MAG: cysteine synthase [Desulfobacterales bacterium]
MNEFCTGILDLIGHTPLVEIRRMNPNPRVKILAKLEYLNPGGSIKDRAALSMIEAAERSGELTAEKIVIEATSGNTGIGLAMVCAVKGYRLLLAMSEAVSLERRKILQARGAQILLTPGHLGTDGAIEEVYRRVREHPDRYVAVDQFNNEANWKAHYHGTAEEIWRQTGGGVTALVAAMGTTGTLMGVSRRLKEYNPAVSVVGVEPYLGHRIQGLKNLKEAYCPEIFERRRLDKKVNVDDEEAYACARRLAREEGLLVGMSSGAAMAAALREAQLLSAGTLVVILPDSGERYLSTALFSDQEKLELEVYNLLSRSREPLLPLQSGRIAMYTCGPHAHRPLQLAEARRFLVADLIQRYLRWRGWAVTQVVDLSDLEPDAARPPAASGHLDQVLEELSWFGIQPAEHTPRARDHAEDMVALARRLAAKGFAYEKLRSLYFSLSRLSAYGRLSGIDPARTRAGAPADQDPFEKDNPGDFALFKRCRLSELKRGAFMKTDWGNMRPSWHLQTTAMATKYLGERFDLHIGSRELLFPHHENENAIAMALTGKPLATCWIHAEQVPGEAPGVRELRARGVAGRELRLWLMSTHYRKPAVFSWERIEAARPSLQRLDGCVAGLKAVHGGGPCPDIDQLIYDIRQGVRLGMDDDLNAPAAIAALFRAVRRINGLAARGLMDEHGAGRVLSAFQEVDAVLGIFDFDPAPRAAGEEVANLLAARETARREGDFELADRLRQRLLAAGVHVQDRTPVGRGS